MHIEEYFSSIRTLITNCGYISSAQITYDVRTGHLGYVKGTLFFLDGSRLEFTEYIDVEFKPTKDDYRYSYIKGKEVIFRYDNCPHHKEIDSFPHHKHVKNRVISTSEPNLDIILREINEIILKDKMKQW